MSAQFTREHLKIASGKILQDLGWHTTNSTPLEFLTDLLQKYIFQLSRTTINYANHFGYNDPTLDHLGLAFRDQGISLSELEEFVKYVNFGEPATQVCKYPVAKESQLNFLKPGSKEVVTRPVHIHEHLPPMNHILEGAIVEKEPTPPITEKAEESTPQENPSVFKKPPDVPHGEFKRIKREDEGSRPTREISSVMMTTSGFLSPAREGRLPEAKTPEPPPVVQPSPPTTAIINPSSEQNVGVLPTKKLPRPMKKIDRKKDKIGKELFKTHGDKTRKNPPKDPFRLKHLKKFSHDLFPDYPQFLNVAKLAQMPSNHKINPVKFNNKVLQAARIKTEKLNTTITPLPMKSSINNRPPIGVDKLHTIPDKKKANILKKISNVKEKTDDKDKIIVKKDVKDEPYSPPDLIIDEQDDIIPKLKQFRSDITIEPVKPVPRNDVNIMCEPMYLDESPPSTPKTPDMISYLSPAVPKEKKKRKPKVPKLPKSTPTPPIHHTNLNDVEPFSDRPKTPKADIDLTAHKQPSIAHPMAEFPFGGLNPYQFGRPNLNFLANFGGPGLIPTPLGNPLNPLFPAHFPLMNLPDFGQNLPKPPNLPTPINSVPKVEETPAPSSLVEPVSLPPPRTPEPVTSSIKTEKVDKKSKEHKKEKKDKLKKKLKKDKIKAEKKEEKKKIKKKEKRDKRKEKEIKEESSTAVPKLTLKLKSPSPRPVTPDTTTKKLNIKPVLKKESEIDEPEPEGANLARISALVTGPPKSKNTPPATPPQQLPPPAIETSFPNSYAIPKKKHKSEIKPIKLKVDMKKDPVLVPAPAPASKYIDAEGNEVWICPTCSRQDDGSPMIGCDGCDAWYHWVCVGIQVPPDENENWYCRHCLLKKDEDLQSDKKKKRKRKDKKEHQ